ncbi:MAG: hypothetical protein ABJD97_08040 [Betaproteobacteria bacterium]
MPRYRSTYSTTKPRSTFPADFVSTRDAFRLAGLDFFCEGSIRYVAVNGGVTFGVFRTIGQAREWLAAGPAQSAARRSAR